MPDLPAATARYAAPADYGAIRPRLQRVRLVTALVACAGALTATTSMPQAWLPALAAGTVAAHALLRRTTTTAVEALVVEAAGLGVAVSVADHVDQVVVAAAAYFIAGAITFGGIRGVLTVLATLASSTVAARALVPAVIDPATGIHLILWVATGGFLVGMALSLAAATSAVAAARIQQQQALAAERRAAEIKQEFVSMVTHELRTPLTNIAGFALTLQETWRHLGPEEADDFLGIVVGEAEHLARLVDDVLALPRLEAGRLLVEVTDFPLQPAAFRISGLVFPAGGERSASVSISGKAVVRADPNRVEQVLRNLLENARKYGGDEVRIEAMRRGAEWVVMVADNGPGVPAQDRARIFEPFEQVTGGDTRVETGFGLGLAVARHLVEAMGGRIWYEPGFPIGSRFCFSLPAADHTGEIAAA